MIRCVRRRAQPVIFALALALSPAAIAAPAGEAQEAEPPAPQAGADDHSYLPPWMQKQKVAGIGSGAAAVPAAHNRPATQSRPETQKAPASGWVPQTLGRPQNNDLFQRLLSLWR